MKVLIPIHGYFLSFLGGLLLFFSGDKTELLLDRKSALPTSSVMTWSNPNHEIRHSVPFKKSPAFSILISKNDTASFIIPLIRIGRLFVIEATIDGETGNLIFDTGATNLVLNRTYFRDYVKSEEQSSVGITGGTGIVEKITANQLFFGLNNEH